MKNSMKSTLFLLSAVLLINSPFIIEASPAQVKENMVNKKRTVTEEDLKKLCSFYLTTP